MSFSNFQSGDWQSFIYSLLLLTILISSLISRRDFAYAKMFKYFAIWSLVGFIFVILYSYRFEFSDFKSRILGEINPSSARVTSEKLIINISQDGHFYLEGKVKNVALRFMIDTGASDIVLGQNDAKRIGIIEDDLEFSKIYHTANGKVFGASTMIDEIEFSGVKFYNVNVSVNGGEMHDSLLGMDFLRKFKRYEFYQDRLVLEL